MPLQFQYAQDSIQNLGVKMAVHGPAGIGKTMLNATLEGVAVAMAEAGQLSLSQANIERVFGKGTPGINYRPVVATITSMPELMEFYQWATQSAEARHYPNLSLDSCTEIAEKVLEKSKQNVKDPRQAYGALIERMTRLLRDFRDIPGKNVLFSFKQAQVKDEGSGLILYGPMMPGQMLQQQVPYFFDEVFAMGVTAKDPANPNAPTYRFLRTKIDAQFSAKDRSGALAELEAPHLGAIIAKIKNQ